MPLMYSVAKVLGTIKFQTLNVSKQIFSVSAFFILMRFNYSDMLQVKSTKFQT